MHLLFKYTCNLSLITSLEINKASTRITNSWDGIMCLAGRPCEPVLSPIIIDYWYHSLNFYQLIIEWYIQAHWSFILWFGNSLVRHWYMWYNPQRSSAVVHITVIEEYLRERLQDVVVLLIEVCGEYFYFTFFTT